MMQENVDQLINKAKRAIEENRQKEAGLLIHRALKLDFDNTPTWLLLQKLLKDDRPLDEFQTDIAMKYYPQQAHILVDAEPTMQPAVLRIPATGLQELILCPGCGEQVFSYASTCPWCDQNLTSPGNKPTPLQLSLLSRRLANLKKELSTHTTFLEEENQIKKEISENSSLTWLVFLGAALSLLLSLNLNFSPLFIALSALVAVVSFGSGLASFIKMRKTRKVQLKLIKKTNALQDEILWAHLKLIKYKESD